MNKFYKLVDSILESINISESFEKEKKDLGIMTDENGIKRSVDAVVKFAEKNKEKYFKKDFSISKLEHDLKWWDKQNKDDPKKSNKRMMKADTSFPLLVIKNKSYGLSVSDGLNRLKKARDVEHKKVIDVYIVPEKDIPDSTILESINISESFEKEKKEGLHGWFSRNKGKGWIDCKTGKPCGREKGEKRKGYPACRPTKSMCNSRKKHKKGSKRISWKKGDPVKS